MADRRPVGEKEFNPLDDTLDLIGQVVSGKVAMKPKEEANPPQLAKRAPALHNVVELEKPKIRERRGGKPEETPTSMEREEFVICKFKVPKSDYQRVKRILTALEEELNARIDFANIGRGWITRLVTAETEILDAAKAHERLKTPNPRNPLEVAEIDHAMAVIQSVGFRRASRLTH